MIEQGTEQPTDDRTETRQGDRLQGVSYLNFLSEYGFGGILADECRTVLENFFRGIRADKLP